MSNCINQVVSTGITPFGFLLASINASSIVGLMAGAVIGFWICFRFLPNKESSSLRFGRVVGRWIYLCSQTCPKLYKFWRDHKEWFYLFCGVVLIVSFNANVSFCTSFIVGFIVFVVIERGFQNFIRMDKIKATRNDMVTEEDLKFIYWGSRLPAIEIKKICIDLLKAGKRYAIGPLIGTSERIVEGMSPLEVINECDNIINLIPNSRSFYYKGMALKQLKRYDEAIIEIQNAITIDQSSETPTLGFLGDDLKMAEKELAKLKNLARRMHIENDGEFNLVKTGAEYEKFICGVITRAGYKCKRVGQSGDYGADILIVLENGTLVVQCKFYSSPVGYAAVQQVYTAKSIYNGTWCCVVSNATFTRQAIDGGRQLGVRLLSHVDIVEYLNSLKEQH